MNHIQHRIFIYMKHCSEVLSDSVILFHNALTGRGLDPNRIV
jgi:hypothetical protein